MKKLTYLAPDFEIYVYLTEEGFAASVDLEVNQDFIQMEGNVISGEEFTEFTDAGGEAESGSWE